MKNIALALLLAAVIAAQIALGGLDAPLVVVAPAAVLFGVTAASVLQGDVSWLSIVCGAVSPLALAWLAPLSPSLGMVVMVGLWLCPRLWLAGSRRDLALAAAVSALAAVVSGQVAGHFAAALPLYYFTACVFSGATLALAAVLVRTDTVVAHALETAARALEGPPADALRRAAELHRHGVTLGGRGRVRDQRWRRLVRLADRRVSLRRLSGGDTERARSQTDREILDLVETIAAEGAAPKEPGTDEAEANQSEVHAPQSPEPKSDQTTHASDAPPVVATRDADESAGALPPANEQSAPSPQEVSGASPDDGKSPSSARGVDRSREIPPLT
jgi:hypothetical protein